MRPAHYCIRWNIANELNDCLLNYVMTHYLTDALLSPPQLAIRLYGNDQDNCHMGRRDRVERPNCMEKGNGMTAICLA